MASLVFTCESLVHSSIQVKVALDFSNSVLSHQQNICIPMSLFIYKPYVMGRQS